MAFAKPNTNLSPLLNQWKSLLQQCAKGESLVTAAQEALLLNGIPEGNQMWLLNYCFSAAAQQSMRKSIHSKTS